MRQLLFLTSLLSPVGATGFAEAADQRHLHPVVNAESPTTLHYDWPILRVGTGEYAEGPTGVTVFHFREKVSVAVDVRGGGPGTVNSAYMDLGYDLPELDTVVFAGGSWYGLEATTAVATALKDDGIRDGNAFAVEPSIAMSVGSIIFDFGSRRLNEIYPDKRLAQAAFRAAQDGIYPLGARGAGRFAKSGGFFGCNAFSGQGGEFRQFGEIKIAAFTVVNALGVVTDREGNTVACYDRSQREEPVKTSELIAEYIDQHAPPAGGDTKNTTVSLVVTNQKLDPAELKRLAAQVHTSMARGLQPFATIYDGDVLYAVSTGEVEAPVYSSAELGVLASEVMWDAILSSVPPQPVHPEPAAVVTAERKALTGFTGEYRFSEFASLEITEDEGKLYAKATGSRDVYAIPGDSAVELLPVSSRDFTVPGRYPLLLRFEEGGGVMVNPGHWQQHGERM
jgi:L-aminopeptidase/D-esterase-like protein